MTIAVDTQNGVGAGSGSRGGATDPPAVNGSFDRALEEAFGRGAALLGGQAATQPGASAGTQIVPATAQPSTPTRKPDAKEVKPKDLTQLSVSELSALPDATGAARAELQSPGAEPAAPEGGESSPRQANGRGRQTHAENPARAEPGEPQSQPHQVKQAQGAAPGSSAGQPAHAPASDQPAPGEPADTLKATANTDATGSAAIKLPGGSAEAAPVPTGAPSAVVAAGTAGAGDSDAGPAQAAPAPSEVKTITGAKSKALLATLEASSRSKFVVEDDEPLTQVSHGLSLALRQGGKATLRLSPDSLGALTIHLHVKDDQVTARLEPTTDSARQLLEAKSHELWAALEARGLSVERIEIDGSRIGQQFGALTQDANGNPDGRNQREPRRREGGAEPRASGIDAGLLEAPSPSVTRVAGGRLRLDALA